MKHIAVLGSTGSIGKQALEVIEAHPDSMRLVALCAGSNTDLLLEQALRLKPKYVGCAVEFDAALLPKGITPLFGADAASSIAALNEVDTVVNGISGFSAFLPLIAALRAGKRVALANKESIVCGHEIVDDALARFGGELLPVDSEQSAIFQCLQSGKKEEVAMLTLTASGGPFWRQPLSQLETVTPEQALCHPTWHMGRKITIDSATLFNKGLEIMEAAYLFGFGGDRIDVLIHPQSIVHSMVTYRDNTTIANLGCPDMRLPIQYAITYPDRSPSLAAPLKLADVAPLEFFRADPERFSAIRLAYDALEAGCSMPLAYNAANEVAVEAFLSGRIGFLDIERAVEDTLNLYAGFVPGSIAEILDADARVRRIAGKCVQKRAERSV